MSVYFINEVRVRVGIANQDGLTQLKRTVELYGGRWHARDEWLEGARENSLVLVEFATMAEARNWYNSSEYMNILHIYVDNAMELALVDGVSPDLTMAGFVTDAPTLTALL